MTLEARKDVCDRLTVKLDNGALTRGQLLDAATILMFVQHDLRLALNQEDALPTWAMLDALAISLRWVQKHRADGTDADIRIHVEAALHAATTSIALIDHAHAADEREQAYG